MASRPRGHHYSVYVVDAMYNLMPYEGARDMEVELGIGLREAGYGVWQA